MGGVEPPHPILLVVTSLATGVAPGLTVTVTTPLEITQVFELNVDKTLRRKAVVEDKPEGV